MYVNKKNGLPTTRMVMRDMIFINLSLDSGPGIATLVDPDLQCRFPQFSKSGCEPQTKLVLLKNSEIQPA